MFSEGASICGRAISRILSPIFLIPADDHFSHTARVSPARVPAPYKRRMRLIPGGCPASARAAAALGRLPGLLFCLAPHGVFLAPELARRAVGSYPAFSPLPAAAVVTSARLPVV
jgi:hypothetical protein